MCNLSISEISPGIRSLLYVLNEYDNKRNAISQLQNNFWVSMKYHNPLRELEISNDSVFIPPATKLGGYTGITMSVRPSVRLSVWPSVRLSVRPSVRPHLGFRRITAFPLHLSSWNFTCRLPMSQGCALYILRLKGQRSRSQCINHWKWFPAHNCFPFTPIIMKLHMQTPHEARMCPIDFEAKRSKVKVTMHKLLKMVLGA